ncbi:MAG: lycopene beta-cyclase CrtY [Kofleriaceae bacterium]|nr:lycopene beta-cyclase CrtY [Kofleriaceae bacterium]
MNGDFDYALVGAGLHNGLIALALRVHQPGARVAVVERGPRPGGNHTWCFHAGDLDDAARAWIDPLVVARWPGYDVAFPAHRRRLDAVYACVSSERLAARLTEALDAPGCALWTGAVATEVAADRVTVRAADGGVHEVRATVVIDARGPDHGAPTACGWQKFLGQELRLAAPHGLDRPVLMDATVDQLDGFRFVYVLPLAPDRLLVEDTYFSDGSMIDAAALRARVAAYVADRGWSVVAVEREETGILPLPWRAAAPTATAPLRAGYAGGWFHPVTGYSFPMAARVAGHVAATPAAALFGPGLTRLAAAHGDQLGFALRLNKMLFRWFPPARRYHVLERFYRLPEPLIRRFYALELTALDRARILVGRPPRGLSLRAALRPEVP